MRVNATSAVLCECRRSSLYLDRERLRIRARFDRQLGINVFGHQICEWEKAVSNVKCGAKAIALQHGRNLCDIGSLCRHRSLEQRGDLGLVIMTIKHSPWAPEEK
jgi:hypothetical protein